jgi:lipopolysaccharide export system permease protein
LARLAECLAVPLLPLMAIPLGMAAKRGRRVSGLILGAVLLLGFQHALQLVKALAETGRFAPVPAIAVVFAIWASLCLWLFASSQQRPGDTPLSRLIDAVQARVQEIRGLFVQREISSPSAV